MQVLRKVLCILVVIYVEADSKVHSSREDIFENGTIRAKILSAKATAPVITSASKLSGAAAALPPALAAKGAALGSMIATPVEAGAVAMSGILSGITAFFVSVPVAVDTGFRSWSRRGSSLPSTRSSRFWKGPLFQVINNFSPSRIEVRNKRSISLGNVTSRLGSAVNSISPASLRNLSFPKIDTLASNVSSYLTDKLLPNYFKAQNATPLVSNVSSIADAPVTTHATPDSNQTMISILEDMQNKDNDRLLMKPLIRIRKQATERMQLSQAAPLAESMGYRECICRLICLVRCDPKTDKTSNKNVHNTIRDAEKSGVLQRLPTLAPYRDAVEKGKQAASSKKCKVCEKTYPCRYSTKQMLETATRLDLQLQ